ncbi:hypothetical protein C2S52_000511 [Perilla frutescens var. hirtella]|nr:hypothetical protein C2S52_000511 [Perilla frutescens var. hirtella]
MSMLELSHFDFERSMSRATHLADTNTNRFPSIYLETSIIAGTSAFFVFLQVGANLLRQRLYLDTGSSLLWFYCEPCIKEAPVPLFNPKGSSSFRRESCMGTQVCSSTSPVKIGCDGGTDCLYAVRYAGNNFNQGYLGKDRVRFEHEGDIVDGVVFGCAKYSSITKVNGVLGLRNNSISLMGQLGISKFAYCIGNITDTADEYSKLLIGDDVELMGDIIPLIVQGQYYINLEQIKIGDKKLDINPKILRRNEDDYTGGLMLDTGSTYTIFPLLVVEKFIDELYWLIGHLFHENSVIKHRNYNLHCYDGVVSRDLIDFPTVRLIFESGATMELTPENIFRQFDNEIFCLAIVPSEYFMGLGSSEILLLGNIMQQYYYFAYDLKQQKLSFTRMDCAVLDPW